MKIMLLAFLGGFLIGLSIVSALLYSSFSGLPITFLAIGAITFLSVMLLWSFYQVTKLKQHYTKLQNAKNKFEMKVYEEQYRFQTLFEQTHVGMAILDLHGKFLRINQPLLNLLGYTQPDILTMNFFNLVHQDALKNLQLSVQQLLDYKLKTYQSEHKCFKQNGDSIWVMSTLTLIRDRHELPAYFIIQLQNITLQKNAEAQLRHMAYHDPVTGLANRNRFEQFVTQLFATSRRHHQGFALLFLDLDRFKTINDTIGHEAGDTLLQIIAERLRSTVRETDLVARLGGDEFILVITDINKAEHAAIVAQKVLECVQRVIVLKGQEIYITTSIGISLYPHDGQTIQTLMKNADLALYRSKEHGRNNYEFYTLEMTSKAQEKLMLQNTLAHALVKEEFLLHYQPKINLINRRITGIEAFLRWNNNHYGAVPTDEIISLAEETGLIIPVSEWINITACKHLKRWQDLGFTSLSISVNCSARQLKHPSFVKDLLDTILEAGLNPHNFEVEIKESTIMQDSENALRVLYAIKEAGIQIAIDDFGTGYWSLNNLRHLLVDRIKIDKTFIRNVITDESSATITKAIIAMSNKLGIISVAEGVEKREEYEFLYREGCTEVQGYYITQPIPADKMTEFLKHPIPDAERISHETITS